MKSGNKKMSQDQSTSGSPESQNSKKDAAFIKELHRTIEILLQDVKDMRLTTLYNKFDLEATRRERDFLIKEINRINDNNENKN